MGQSEERGGAPFSIAQKCAKVAINKPDPKLSIAVDQWNVPPVLDYQNDTEFMHAFDAIGIHYPCTAASEKGQGNALLAAGKKLWASEDWWSEAEWGGAACWAKLFSAHRTPTAPQPPLPSPRSDRAI